MGQRTQRHRGIDFVSGILARLLIFSDVDKLMKGHNRTGSNSSLSFCNHGNIWFTGNPVDFVYSEKYILEVGHRFDQLDIS